MGKNRKYTVVWLADLEEGDQGIGGNIIIIIIIIIKWIVNK
jgi:hypothetical protein